MAMDDDVMRAKLMELVDILLSEPAEVDLGDICASVKYDLGVGDDHEVKRLTFETVREILRRGARVDFDGGVVTGTQHPERTPDEIIARIAREWNALGEMPTIFGEICIFEWTPSGMEAYAQRPRT
jgi:hypothetical protein